MYVPEKVFADRLEKDWRGAPVMVWIHGGAFLGGTGARAAYPPEAIMEAESVVLVAINYRLEAGGSRYLCSKSEKEPNYGGFFCSVFLFTYYFSAFK